MDREQEEMQFLGLFGVFTESFKIISSWRKIFTQITLTLILPLSLIYLLHIEVTNLLLRKIFYNAQEMSNTPFGSPRYDKLSDLVSSEWATFWLFKIIYFTLVLIFSLLSTSAVVYTVASVYTARDFTFRKVMSVVPKVWKRLMVTFLCVFAALSAYHIIAFLVGFIWAVTIGIRSNGGIAVLVILVIFFFAGFVYLTIIWQLACVVSVLEESYGVRAMRKSQELIKGKMGLAIVIFLMLNVTFIAIQVLFNVVVVHGWRLGSLDRTAYAILCFLLLSAFFLFGLVIQTVLYFLCKSYHHENIDKSSLSDHLEAFLGEYVPLKARDVQLEQYHV